MTAPQKNFSQIKTIQFLEFSFSVLQRDKIIRKCFFVCFEFVKFFFFVLFFGVVSAPFSHFKYFSRCTCSSSTNAAAAATSAADFRFQNELGKILNLLVSILVSVSLSPFNSHAIFVTSLYISLIYSL